MQASRIGLAAASFIVLALSVSYHSYASSVHGPTASEQNPPPTSSPTPVEDTQRYVAWMEKQGKSIKDKPHEDVSSRIGDWGFFYRGDRSVGSWTPLQDRVGLDRSGHAVTQAETGDWNTFLRTDGLDAAGALKRVAWLFNAGALNPADEPKGGKNKITAPTLIPKNDSITFQGWWEAFSDPPYTRRITITTTPTSTKLVIDR
jgi:hypothetical protein